MTELQMLKKKCLTTKGVKKQNASKADLARMKQLQDAEPVSAADIKAAEEREAQLQEDAVAAFEARRQEKSNSTGDETQSPNPELDKPAPAKEHPRVVKLKAALSPFTQLEVDVNRDDAFVLINRGVAITAGMVRAARKALQV